MAKFRLFTRQQHTDTWQSTATTHSMSLTWQGIFDQILKDNPSLSTRLQDGDIVVVKNDDGPLNNLVVLKVKKAGLVAEVLP